MLVGESIDINKADPIPLNSLVRLIYLQKKFEKRSFKYNIIALQCHKGIGQQYLKNIQEDFESIH